MRGHKLKVWPEPFRALRDGRKTCELRSADRDFRVNDYLLLVEFDPQKDVYLGGFVHRRITHIVTDENVPRGLVSGFVVLSLDEVSTIELDQLQSSNVEWVKPQ